MKKVCNWLIKPDSGNSIHQWRVLKFRLTLGSGLLVGLAAVGHLFRKPDSSEIFFWGLFFWIPIYYLLHLRSTAAGAVIQYKRMIEAGQVRGLAPSRKQMTRTYMIVLLFGILLGGAFFVDELLR